MNEAINTMQYSYILQICVLLVTVSPLVIALIKYVKKSIKEKNWTQLIDLICKTCVEAEKKFECGVDKKDWTMAIIESTAKSINFEIDKELLSKLIDDIVMFTKDVNFNSKGNMEDK